MSVEVGSVTSSSAPSSPSLPLSSTSSIIPHPPLSSNDLSIKRRPHTTSSSSRRTRSVHSRQQHHQQSSPRMRSNDMKHNDTARNDEFKESSTETSGRRPSWPHHPNGDDNEHVEHKEHKHHNDRRVYEGRVMVSGRMTHLRVMERVNPWRLDIKVVHLSFIIHTRPDQSYIRLTHPCHYHLNDVGCLLGI
jgi:hypothetical protein